MRELLEANDATWRRVRDRLVFDDGEVVATIAPERIIKTAKTVVRSDAEWRDIWHNLTNDGELFADGHRPDTIRFERDWEIWKKQGWYPKQVSVPGFALTMYHKSTRKAFRAEFEREDEARDKANEAIPKLRERKRPAWLAIFESAETAEQLIASFGPPPEWSGAVGAALGPERRKLMTSFWRKADAKVKERLNAAFQDNFHGEATTTSSVDVVPRPFARRWRKRVCPAPMEEQAPLPVGTTRQWKRGEYIKVGERPAVWEPFEPATQPLAALGAALRAGIQTGTLDQHTSAASEEIAKHTAGLPGFVAGLRQTIGSGFTLHYRVKSRDSVLGKMARKPKRYPNPSLLTDLTGAEIEVETEADATAAFEALRANYEIIESEDMISTPRPEGYRAIHAIIRDRDGLAKEVQILTRRQRDWKYWFHDIYKPTTPKQAKAIYPILDAAAVYGRALSDHLAAADKGLRSSAPPCPPAIAKAVGCGPT